MAAACSKKASCSGLVGIKAGPCEAYLVAIYRAIARDSKRMRPLSFCHQCQQPRRVCQRSHCAYDVGHLSEWLVGNEARGLVFTFGKIHHMELERDVLLLENDCHTKCAGRCWVTVQLQDHSLVCCGYREKMEDTQLVHPSSFYRNRVRQMFSR